MCAALTERIAASAGGKVLVWLDFFAYTRKLLLAGGEIPWVNPGEFIAYHRQAQRLLSAGVAVLPLGHFFDAYLKRNPELLRSMAGKKRPGFALKTLLADEAPRALLIETAGAMRASYGSMPVVVTSPSPRAWVSWAHERANGPTSVAPTPDDIEAAAMYMADFFRIFAHSGIDGLLLEEASGAGPASASELGWYQPVINVALHYRWDLGVKASGAPFLPGPDQGIAFVITDVKASSGVTGIVLPDSFWSEGGAPACPGNCFYFAEIPEDAKPEQVLERLSKLVAN